jgi:uncharacterized OB-fold protein
MAFSRELPPLTDLNRAFWTGGHTGQLQIWRCQDCRFWCHPPRPMCSACRSRNVSSEPVSGDGVVFSFAINRRAWRPGLPVPYVLALIELAEQPALRFTSNVVDCDPGDVYIGMPVTVTFIEQDGVYIPVFQPA